MVFLCLSWNPGLGSQPRRQWHLYEPTVLTQTVELWHWCHPELHSSTSGGKKEGVRLCPSPVRPLSSSCPSFSHISPPGGDHLVSAHPRVVDTKVIYGKCAEFWHTADEPRTDRQVVKILKYLFSWLEKTLMLARGEADDRGWHHLLNGHEFEQTPGDSEGQRSLGCCSPWVGKESDRT